MAGYIKYAISLILFALLSLGIHDLLSNIYPNRCEMTYMYEYPEFIEVKLTNSRPKNHSNYKLYAYGEGRYAELLKRRSFKGIPVLFIPGNAGSYKQVRSLASVAYRMAKDKKRKFHFNFFSVDLNEDFSGVYGPALFEQTEFVGVAIRTILGLYPNSSAKPSSVVLVGHSLGGMVARAVVTLPEIPASHVPLIITMATPHARPALISDPKISSFYEFVNDYWLVERIFDLKDNVLVSIGSGRNDLQVGSFLASYSLADVDTTTLSVPQCWLTTDHQAIVWCRQLVLAITRALFDSIDPKTLLVTSNSSKIIDIFNYQLLERPGPKYSFPVEFPSTLSQLEFKGHWSEVMKRQHRLELSHSAKDYFLMIPLNKGSSHYKHLTIVGKEIEWMNWVFACQANVYRQNVRLCSTGVNLSQRGRLIPHRRKEIVLDVEPLVLEGHSHVVVWIQPNDNDVTVDFDMNDGSARAANVSAPPVLQAFSPQAVVETSPEKALSYNLSISDINEGWQSYSLLIEPISCRAKPLPTVAIKSKGTNGRWEYLSNRKNSSSYPLEIDVPPLNKNETDTLDVHIILNPECKYKISLQGNFIGVFRRMAFLYGMQFASFCVCHFLLVLAYQVKNLGETGKTPSALSGLLTLSPIAVVPFVKLSTFLLRQFDIINDPATLSHYGIDLAVLPIVLFLALLPLSIMISLAIWAAVILSGKTAHSFATRILRRTLRTGDVITDMAVAGLLRIPVVVGIGLVAISYATCGALGLLLATGFYFIKVFKLYEDYLEYLLWSLVPGTRESQSQRDYLSSVNIHFTLMILQGLSSLFYLPTLIAWAKSRGEDVQLASDPSLFSCCFCIFSLSFLWQFKRFSPRKKHYKYLGHLIHICAVLVILFGSLTVYRASYCINLVLFFTMLHQVFAPLASESDQPSQVEGEESRPITMNIVRTLETEAEEEMISSSGTGGDVGQEPLGVGHDTGSGFSSDSNSFSSDSNSD